MTDTIIVGFILVVAALYVAYRLFFRHSCGCGSACGSCCSEKEDASLVKKSMVKPNDEASAAKPSSKKECCGNSSCHCSK